MISSNLDFSGKNINLGSLYTISMATAHDRINLSSCSDVKPNPAVLLPSCDDLSKLKDELMVLVS